MASAENIPLTDFLNLYLESARVLLIKVSNSELSYNDIRYNSKIRYNVNSVCTKISGLCIFSLAVLCNSLGKHTFWIFVRLDSPRRF